MIRAECRDGTCAACSTQGLIVRVTLTSGGASGTRALCLPHAGLETRHPPSPVRGHCTSCGTRGAVHEFGSYLWSKFVRAYAACARCAPHLTERVATVIALGDGGAAEWDPSWTAPAWTPAQRAAGGVP